MPDPDSKRPPVNLGGGIKLSARQWLIAASLGVLAVVALGLAYFNAGTIASYVEHLDSLIRQGGIGGVVLIIALMVVHSFVFFPLEILAAIAGATYGFWWGTLYVWIGAMIAAATSFLLARWLGRPFVERLLSPRHLEMLDSWSARSGALTLFTARFLPIISFNIVNYAAGLMPVSFFTFMLTTAIGCIPLIAVSVLVGVGFDLLPLPIILTLSLVLIAAILGGHWWAHKRGWL